MSYDLITEDMLFMKWDLNVESLQQRINAIIDYCNEIDKLEKKIVEVK
jgi:hypothetical protein